MKRLNNEVEEWILEALAPFNSEREWTWETNLVASPQGVLRLMYLSTPGIVLGTVAMNVVLVPLVVTKEGIFEAIEQQVAAINEQMAEALRLPSNGSEPPSP